MLGCGAMAQCGRESNIQIIAAPKKLQALEIEKKVIEHQLFLQSLPLGIFHELIQIDGSSLWIDR